MNIAYVGRFRPGWATERDLANALTRAGHSVVEVAEGATDGDVDWRSFDLALWTPSDLALGCPAIQAALARKAVPVVGYQLDLFWGLRREAALRASAWLSSDLLVTADGGHDAEWQSVGVRHRWLPPAVDRDEASIEGRYRTEYDVDVAFVGSWRNYHREWPHRSELVFWLQRQFDARCGIWPRAGEPLLRGQDLADLYASAKIVVGDSCSTGGGHYWSDRVPGALGGGAFLLHPRVDGMEQAFKDGEHLVTWPAYDWQALREAIDAWLDHPMGRVEIALSGREHVLVHATYDNRASELLAICADEGLL